MTRTDYHSTIAVSTDDLDKALSVLGGENLRSVVATDNQHVWIGYLLPGRLGKVITKLAEEQIEFTLTHTDKTNS